MGEAAWQGARFKDNTRFLQAPCRSLALPGQQHSRRLCSLTAPGCLHCWERCCSSSQFLLQATRLPRVKPECNPAHACGPVRPASGATCRCPCNARAPSQQRLLRHGLKGLGSVAAWPLLANLPKAHHLLRGRRVSGGTCCCSCGWRRRAAAWCRARRSPMLRAACASRACCFVHVLLNSSLRALTYIRLKQGCRTRVRRFVHVLSGACACACVLRCA